jgi:hypothetical protein
MTLDPQHIARHLLRLNYHPQLHQLLSVKEWIVFPTERESNHIILNLLLQPLVADPFSM